MRLLPSWLVSRSFKNSRMTLSAAGDCALLHSPVGESLARQHGPPGFALGLVASANEDSHSATRRLPPEPGGPRSGLVFLDHGESQQAGQILEPLAPVAEGRTAVYAVLVGVDVRLNSFGVDRRHDLGPSHHFVEVVFVDDGSFEHGHGRAGVHHDLLGEHVDLPHRDRLVRRIEDAPADAHALRGA